MPMCVACFFMLLQVYAFGSNSSSQLAMQSTDKFPTATVMPHMANCQFVSSMGYTALLMTLLTMFVVLSD